MDKVSLNFNEINTSTRNIKNTYDSRGKNNFEERGEKLQGQLDSLAFCGKTQIISNYEKRKLQKDATDKFLKININSRTEDIKELLKNKFLTDVQRESLERILEKRQEKGEVDNPFELDLSNGNKTASYSLKIYDGKNGKYQYYSIKDDDLNTNSSDEPNHNGVLKPHSESYYAGFTKKMQYDKEGAIQSIIDSYNKTKDEKWGNNKTILEHISESSLTQPELDKTKTIKELFPREEDYIKAVLDKVDGMAQEEKDYLKTLEPMKDKHIFYRGLWHSNVMKETGALSDNTDKWTKGDIVIPQFNPMFVTGDIKTAAMYLRENKNGTHKMFRIITPEGAHITYSQGQGQESILPSKSKFKYMGTDKINNLDIVNLEYMPE